MIKEPEKSERHHHGAAWLLEKFGDLIACPCGGEFNTGHSDDEVACTNCGLKYDFLNGVLSPKDANEEETEQNRLKQQEEKIRDRQAPMYDFAFGLTIPGWLEGRWAERAITDLCPDVALDIGCGTGRMTLPLSKKCKRVVGIDRSLLSLHNNRKKLQDKGTSDNVLLVKGDATSLPLKREVFDFAITTQMIQHLPSEELRSACVEGVAVALKPDSTFLATFYEWREGRTPWRHKEGVHKAGIYFYRFTPEDVRRLLGPQFDLKSVESSLGRLLLTKSARKPG